jgi:parallel beta-helix repeat protein
MSRKFVLTTFFITVLIGTLAFSFEVQRVEASGTIYIRADGSIDPPTAAITTADNITYVLTGNITSDANGIVVERNNIILDGAGHMIEGTRAAGFEGIDISGISNVTVKSVNVKWFFIGSLLHYSSNVKLRNNTLAENKYNFGVSGWEFSHFIHDVDVSNLVDGNPIYYLINQRDLTINPSTFPNVGYLALVNSTNIAVENLTLQSNWQGILLALTTNSAITRNNITNNDNGIELQDSLNNTISGNSLTNNGYGIMMRGSSNNSIVRNCLISCSRAIDIEQYGGFENREKSSNNSIVENNIEHREWGVRLSWSSNSTLRGNNITGQFYSSYYGVGLENSIFNEIAHNTIRNNEVDISLQDSHGNNIVQNNVSTTAGWSSYGYGTGISLASSTLNTISQNDIAQNYYGILMKYSYPGCTNTIYHNNFVNNTYGMYLQQLSNNTISGNSFWNDGLFVQDSYENSVVDNLVNGKPLVYLEGASGLRVEDAGQVVLVGCNNITVENLNLSNTVVAIQLWQTDNTKISSNNIANNMEGIDLDSSSNNSFVGNTISHNSWEGIRLSGTLGSSNYNNIMGNNIANNDGAGIGLYWSSNYNTISGNDIRNNSMGIWLDQSSNNTISGNNITNNQHGISLSSSYNKIGHNNFINNTWQASSGWVNAWDDGYPSGGNYWSNYTGVDMNSGFYQNQTDSDGIGDMPHTIDANNIDNYPLMAPISFFDAGTWNDTTYYVNIVSNSTLSHFHFKPDEGAFVSLSVKGETVTEALGFCRVAIPKDLLWVEDGWTVLYGSYPLSYETFSDENYTYLYFIYTNPPSNGFTTLTINGTHVIPEFPSFLILPILMIPTLLAVIVYRRRMEAEN